MARLTARGREESTPAVVHFVQLIVIGAFVGLLIVAALVVRLLLR